MALSKDQAILVVLTIGLFIRDISASHFYEGDGDHLPHWVRDTPLRLSHSNSLLLNWKKQLARSDESFPDEPEEDSKGKGKAKARPKSGKRRAKSPIPEPVVRPS
jgi:hypothetical protein